MGKISGLTVGRQGGKRRHLIYNFLVNFTHINDFTPIHTVSAPLDGTGTIIGEHGWVISLNFEINNGDLGASGLPRSPAQVAVCRRGPTQNTQRPVAHSPCTHKHPCALTLNHRFMSLFSPQFPLYSPQ